MTSVGQWGRQVWRAVTTRPSVQANPMLLFPSTAGSDGLPRGASDVLDSYGSLPWLRAVTGKIGASIAATQWQVYAIRKAGGKAQHAPWLQRSSVATRRKALSQMVSEGDAEPILDYPLLDVLHNGNPYHTGVQLWRLTQASIDLVGEAFWIKDPNGLGVTAAVWPIPPTWVTAVPTIDKPVYTVNFKGRYGTVPEASMLWFKDPSPANPYGRGSGIAHTLGDELATDEYATKLVRQFFLSGARPDFMLWPTGELGMDPTERKRFETEWANQHQGFQRAFRPHVAGQPVGIHEFEKDFSKMQMIELRQFERDVIIHTYGLPPELLGIIEASNRSTIDAAETIYARHVLIPRLELLRSILQQRLAPEFDERVILDYVSPEPEDRVFQLDAAKAAPWALSVNEWRSRAGLPAAPDGDVRMVPPTLMPLADLREPADEGLPPEPKPPKA